MNITLFIGSLYGGGAERVTCNLASYLAEKGHRVRILVMSESKEQYDLNEKVEKKFLLPLKDRKNTVWNNFVRFHRLIKYMHINKNEDCYIVMLPVTIVIMLLLRRFTKAKIIVSERADPSKYSNKMQKLLKKLAQRADGWVFQTEDAKAWYQDVIGNIPAVVIPNAINPAFIQTIYMGERKKEIVAAGRLNDQKNFSLLIEAFARISEDYKEYTLTIYGEGPNRNKLEEQVKKLSLQNRVYLPGNVLDIADKIKKSSLFVLSSNYEGMPNALMEAMALGLPCISTDCPVGGPRYLIKNEVNGLLVPTNNISDMEQALRRALQDPLYARVMGNEAMKIRFSLAPEVIYGKWEKMILNNK